MPTYKLNEQALAALGMARTDIKALSYALDRALNLISTDLLPEGDTNLYYTNARARAAISVSGDLSYNPTSGVITYNAPTSFPWAGLTGKPTTIAGYGIADFKDRFHEELYELVVSVKSPEFGATGDGSTDDAAAIQAAIDYVYDAGGGLVWLPVGDYVTSTALMMRRGVALAGPAVRVSAGQTYESNAEAAMVGMARIMPNASVTTAAIKFDFSDATIARRPYGVTLHNVYVDCANQGSGYGIHFAPGSAAEGPFSNGSFAGAAKLDTVYVLHAPSYGIYVEGSSTQRISALALHGCRVAFSDNHGIYVNYAFDTVIKDCFSYENDGSGIYLNGTATSRVLECDLFNNRVDGGVSHSGNGITLDSLNDTIRGCNIDNNYGHGVAIIGVTNTTANKQHNIIACRIGSNGGNGVGVYDNVSIGDIGGTAITGINFVGCMFGLALHNSVPTARVRNHIYSSALSTQNANSAVGCVFTGTDLNTSSAPLNDNFWTTAIFSGCRAGDSNELKAKPYTFTANVTSWNTLRGTDFYKTANTVATTVTSITQGGSAFALGREVTILINDANTTIDFSGTNIKGNNGVDYVAPSGTVLFCKCYDGTNWACSIVKPS